MDLQHDTVWLTQKEMSLLFDVSSDSIGLHIKNIFKDDELDSSTTEESSVVQKEGGRKIQHVRKAHKFNLRALEKSQEQLAYITST